MKKLLYYPALLLIAVLLSLWLCLGACFLVLHLLGLLISAILRFAFDAYAAMTEQLGNFIKATKK